MPNFAELVMVTALDGTPCMSFDGESGEAIVGAAKGKPGALAVLNGTDQTVVVPGRINMSLHRPGKTGVPSPRASLTPGRLDLQGCALFYREDINAACIEVGESQTYGVVAVKNASGETSIHLDGKSGDITLLGADTAEDFEIVDPTTAIAPGTVMVLDDDGRLQVSTQCYDRRVAGIVSGASDLKPGIILGRSSGNKACVPIALVGRVFCYVDASECGVEVGDMLTTSSRPGYAMKARDPARSIGTLIGKSMGRLDSGQGLVQVLVSLQ